MKYTDIIGLQDYFHPVFNLQNEGTTDYWKQFIPTTQFNVLLEKTLDAVSSNIPSNRKSIWVQGTFGTGKSHAGAVIKHLLCDDIAKITDYIYTHIENPNLKTRLTSLRNGKHYFPVVLSGVEGAYNPHTFALTLERTIKETLRKAGHQISVNSDFERAVELIENNDVLDFEKIIKDNLELQQHGTKKDVLQKLKSADIKVYLNLEATLQKYNVQLSSQDITQWLSEVEIEIKDKRIADGLLIFWDEFTSVMDTISSGLINTLQKIAELSEKQHIYLYLISHRAPMGVGNKSQDIAKMSDRFHIVQYRMEAVTTYRIMAATLKKNDTNVDGVLVSYDVMRDMKMQKFDTLISYLTDNESQQSKEDVKNLFPLHPYTAFLCSSLSDHIGSANRSVFNFMYDSDNGFLSFLNDENAYNEKKLLTVDCLWDFFLKDFEKDFEKYGTVITTFNTHIRNVEINGLSYAKIFKGILLLNAMRNKMGEVDKILPSTKNIKDLFCQEDFEKEIDAVLDYFDKNQIIQRDPSDNFLIATSSLPADRINEQRKNAENRYKDALEILKFDQNAEQSVKNIFSEKAMTRKVNLCLLPYFEDDSHIKSRFSKEFKKEEPYSLRIALFFSINEQERQATIDLIKRLSSEDFQDVIFIVFHEVFDNDEQQKLKFIQYVANQQVATQLNMPKEAENNKKYATAYPEKWVNRLSQQGNYTLFFNGKENIGTSNTVAQYINQNIGYKIFSSGYEILSEFRKQKQTFYNSSPAKTAAEAMLYANDRNNAEERLKKSTQITPAKFLFKNDNDDYVVEQNLNLKPDVPDTHPLVLVKKKVDELLEKARQQHTPTFNLGQVLYPLTKAPFGLYSNIPNVALLSFALREYQNKLYHTANNGLGVPITLDILREKVGDLFNYWQNDKNKEKLNVRFGSKEEKDLKEDLIKIFDLHNVPEVDDLASITSVCWGIVHYCKHKSKYPVWSLKYFGSSSDALNNVIDQIVEIVQKEEATAEQIKKLYKALQEQKMDLQKLLLNPKAFENGFRNYIRTIESIIDENDWWNDLYMYFSERMQPEIGYWKEADVENRVLRFVNEKNRQTEEKPTSQDGKSPTIETPPATPPTASQVKAKNVVTKVSQANLQSVQLKLILIEVLNNFPETADLINDNLG